MTKLIFINRFFSPDHSATSQIVSDLAFHLSREGIKVAVVTSRLAYDGTLPMLPAHETIEGVEVHRVATTRFGRGSLFGRIADYGSFYLSAQRMLAGLVEKGDVVVAKTDPPLISVLAHRVAQRRGGRFVNWIQDLYPETAQNLGFRALSGPVGSLLTGLRNRTLRDAHANVVIGERMAARVAAAGADPAKVHVICNWVDEQAIRPVAPADNPLRREWSLADRFVVAYSGNLGRAHEVDTLLDAAQRLRGEGTVTFLFIGGGHGTTALKSEVSRRGLDDLFVFRPYQPAASLSRSLSVGDVHWLSLRPQLEGLIVPSKLYGIAAVGRPIIAVGAPDGEVGRLVSREGCGVAVAQGDGEGLAAAIRRLRDDVALREAQGRRARALVETVLSRAGELAKWQALVEDLSRPASA